MLSNQEIIEKTGASEHLTDCDREMLDNYGQKLGSRLCYILRHHPEKIGVDMDRQGWVNMEELIRNFNAHNSFSKLYLTLPVLMEVVRTDNKQRYGLKEQEDHLMIRCRQGHSIPWLEMDYAEAEPQQKLYHGTIEPNLESIFEKGILPMQRQMVHLSGDIATAQKVAERRREKGVPVILEVDAEKMTEEGVRFYLSENGVWLTDRVDPKYVKVVSRG